MDNLESPMFQTLLNVEETLRTYYEIKDWQGIRIILAVAVAHYVPGEPLWFRIRGASRSGKTELLRAILKFGESNGQSGDVTELEAITPASIRGGLKDGHKVLERLNGKLVVTKDLATIITTRKDSRLEIFGLLRSVKDGQLSSDFGNEVGHISQTVIFDWIIATTQAIDGVRQIESLLGERYIDLQWIPGDRELMAFRASINNPNLKIIRDQLATDVCSLMSRAKEIVKENEITISEEEAKFIAKLADAVALCRSPIQRNNQGDILSVPQPEIGTSLAQDFSRVVLGLVLLGIEDWQPYIRRLAWDCIPSIRVKLLKALQVKAYSINGLVQVTGLPRSTVQYHLSDLKQLGIVECNNLNIGDLATAPNRLKIELP